MGKLNGTIEDVCALIGFTATTRLINWFGGSNVYVPGDPTDDHTLACLIGPSGMRALCAEFGDSAIWIPAAIEDETVSVKKQIAELFLSGGGSLDVSKATGLSQRHVQRIRRELESVGVLPQVLGSGCKKNAQRKMGG